MIPAIGRNVIILKGRHKGEEAVLSKLKVEDFSADLELKDGSKKTLPYEHFSKKYEP